jgi:hypothetical protein
MSMNACILWIHAQSRGSFLDAFIDLIDDGLGWESPLVSLDFR